MEIGRRRLDRISTLPALKRFDRWMEGLVGDLLGLARVNPYYDYPYRVLHLPLYLLFGEFDLGDSFGSGFVVARQGAALARRRDRVGDLPQRVGLGRARGQREGQQGGKLCRAQGFRE